MQTAHNYSLMSFGLTVFVKHEGHVPHMSVLKHLSSGSTTTGRNVRYCTCTVPSFLDRFWRNFRRPHIEFHENSSVGSRDTRGNVQFSWCKLALFIDRFQQNLECAYEMYSDARLWRMMEIPLMGHEMFTNCYFDPNAKCSELPTDLNETYHIWIIAIISSRWWARYTQQRNVLFR